MRQDFTGNRDIFYREMRQYAPVDRDTFYRDLRQDFPHNPLMGPRNRTITLNVVLRTLNHNNFSVVAIFRKGEGVERESHESFQDEPDLLPPKIIDGKDELNLAEFPLSAIADRLNPDQKTLNFEDRIFDPSRGEMVARQLTITASDNYGLPTAHDDEVILGLVQLSKLKQFADRRVHFTRYQLIRLLGWRDEGKSYERLEKSLNRWVGVTLYYKNAWWSKEDKCWVDEKFHILDNVTFYDKERARNRSHSNQQPQLPLSSFTWNDVIFRSFKAGNLKSIDFDFLKSLDSSVAKRLYRFLDKRFYHRKRWEFNLKEVSWEHIGLSRNYDAANIKRKLLPAIRELEERGFLKPMVETERFVKISSGEWQVLFESATAAPAQKKQITTTEGENLIQALAERGVTPSTASQTLKSHSPERIKAQLEVFDWIVFQKDPKVSRNPAGFLISSIRNEYAPPKGYISREERVRREAQASERKRKEEERAAVLAAQEEARKNQQEQAVERFWTAFSDPERERLMAEALDQASEVERQVMERGGAFASAAKKSLLDTYALKLMEQAA